MILDALFVRLLYIGVRGYPPSGWALDNWCRYHGYRGDWATFEHMAALAAL